MAKKTPAEMSSTDPAQEFENHEPAGTAPLKRGRRRSIERSFLLTLLVIAGFSAPALIAVRSSAPSSAFPTVVLWIFAVWVIAIAALAISTRAQDQRVND